MSWISKKCVIYLLCFHIFHVGLYIFMNEIWHSLVCKCHLGIHQRSILLKHGVGGLNNDNSLVIECVTLNINDVYYYECQIQYVNGSHWFRMSEPWGMDYACCFCHVPSDVIMWWFFPAKPEMVATGKTILTAPLEKKWYCIHWHHQPCSYMCGQQTGIMLPVTHHHQ